MPVQSPPTNSRFLRLRNAKLMDGKCKKPVKFGGTPAAETRKEALQNNRTERLLFEPIRVQFLQPQGLTAGTWGYCFAPIGRGGGAKFPVSRTVRTGGTTDGCGVGSGQCGGFWSFLRYRIGRLPGSAVQTSVRAVWQLCCTLKNTHRPLAAALYHCIM